MALGCGIIGLPNVGKSTLFNALTSANIEASNFPFCTIEPNSGVVMVPDARLHAIAGLVKPERCVPASVEFVDIAGLVRGASKGEGLGNAFLANIRETQALVQVVRCFASDEIVHVHNQVNPVADVEIINTELALADLDTVSRQLAKRHRLAQSGNAQARRELDIFKQVEDALNLGKAVRQLPLDDEQRQLIDACFLLTSKPMLYLANVDEDAVTHGNAYSHQLAELAEQQGAQTLVLCNAIEEEIAQLDVDSQGEFLADLGLAEPGLHRLIRAGYRLLDLHTYFTAGKQEARAWTFPRGALAPDAAAVIHTDFKRGFIRAEVIGYDNFIACKGEQGAKEAGKWRLEGKEYPVQDGDVIHFRFNT